MSCADIATQTARQTSQLQPSARRKISSALSVVPFSSAIWLSRSNVMPAGSDGLTPAVPITPVLTARK